VTEFNEVNQKRLRELLWRLDICNCGNCVVWKYMKLFLERAADKQRSFYEVMASSEAPVIDSEVVEFVGQLLDAMKLIEHGSSIGGAWPTPDGQLLLDFLHAFDYDDKKWPVWASSEE
jgi:hypothetical protein